MIIDINGFKFLTPNHKAVIFDEINWRLINRETKIHLLEKMREVNIKTIYEVVKLPSKLIKVVRNNNSKDFIDL